MSSPENSVETTPATKKRIEAAMSPRADFICVESGRAADTPASLVLGGSLPTCHHYSPLHPGVDCAVVLVCPRLRERELEFPSWSHIARVEQAAARAGDSVGARVFVHPSHSRACLDGVR